MNHAKCVGVQEHWCGLGQYYSCLQWVGECPLSMACVNTVHMWLQGQTRPWFPEFQSLIWLFMAIVLTSLCKAGLSYCITLWSGCLPIKKNNNKKIYINSISLLLQTPELIPSNLAFVENAFQFHTLSLKFRISVTVRKSWCSNSLSQPLRSVI